MKLIKELIPDIQRLVTTKGGWFDESLAASLSGDIGRRLLLHFGERVSKPTLRLSKMGPYCPSALWHSIHRPDLAQSLPPWAEIKYSFGHILEGLAISLAKAAGHTVEGEQDELCVDGVFGHRDCVIDGCLVDVKSSSSYSFRKFQDGSIKDTDWFGYLDQLDGYLVGSLQDDIVKVKDKGYLLVIDKQLGHLCLYEHKLREQSIRDRIKEYKRIVNLSSSPVCCCKTEPWGKSGNIKLDTKASYNMYKHCCFSGLRTFLYKDRGGFKPVYLTHVVKRPEAHIVEIDRYGKIIRSSV